MSGIENRYERRGLGDRARELIVLSLFILILAFSSILLADIIIYPFSLFAIGNVTLFNKIFKISILLFTALSFIIFLKRRISHARKIHETEAATWKYLLKRPLHYIALLAIVILSIFIIGSVIYFLFSENYHLLYELNGGR